MAYTNIDKPTDYFETKTWSGASGDLNITGLDFQPDWVWIKSRNTTGADHKLVDVVRGSSKSLKSNETEAESTDAEGIQSFNSDGYTLGDNDGNYNRVGRTYVGWNWLAGGTASSNTDGSVDSTVSVNTTSGFSIVSWNGTTNNKTIGHGLGVAPQMVIAKSRDTGDVNWIVWHHKLSSGYFLKLNLTNAQDNANSYYTENPNNTVIKLTGSTAHNVSGDKMIAYCFAEKKGYSKFGSYTGNGDSSGNGPFIYIGFKPAWIMIKNASTGSSYWLMVDNKRDTFNVTTKKLYANINNGEFDDTHYNFDFLSNGFKLKSTSTTTNYNNSGDTYIYMAFAESPFVTSTGIPTTAR
jgi:hypothetical protein